VAVVVVDCVGAAVVVVVEAAVVVCAHAAGVSPCATCAGTAGLAMLIVCELPLPVTWQTSTFCWPAPAPSASPPVVVVSCEDVLVLVD
jgi:hypothetical protein